MTDLEDYPYATFLDAKFPALSVVDVSALVRARTHRWYNNGHFIVDLEGRSVDLQPREGFVVPRGVVHRTRAPDRAVILMVETAAIVPTGDA